LKKSQSIKSISGITMPVKDGMYFHPFLDKWIPISSITNKRRIP
jgi:hypothetical protein